MMEGKVALITGSAMGLGKAFAEALLQKGAKVCLSDVNVETGKKTLQDMTGKYGSEVVMFIACDVTKKSDMERLFSETKRMFGNIDIVCNNAGIWNEAKWDLMVDVNLKGAVHGTQLALQYMGKDSGGKGGVVINVASLAGFYPFVVAPVYAATKHGVVGLTRSYGSDLTFSKYGVRVNCLCPTFVDTNLLDITPDQVLNYDITVGMIRDIGLLPKETVADVFLNLVGDESKNGESAVVRLNKETEFVPAPVLEV